MTAKATGPWCGHNDQILAALAEHGPMLAADLAAELGVETAAVVNAMRHLRRASKRLAKRVYILRWERLAEGEREYPRAVYALGNRPDARKPPRKHVNEIRRDYMQRRVNRTRATSVFNLALGYRAIARGQA